MARAAFYEPDEVLVSFDGVPLSGFADGEFLTIEQMSPGFTSVVGTDGEVARSKTNDRRVKVVIKLLQTSASNAVLAAAHKADLNSPNGGGVGTLTIVDTSGRSYCRGAQAWITKMPEASYDRSAKSREWELELANGDRVEGGN